MQSARPTTALPNLILAPLTGVAVNKTTNLKISANITCGMCHNALYQPPLSMWRHKQVKISVERGETVENPSPATKQHRRTLTLSQSRGKPSLMSNYMKLYAVYWLSSRCIITPARSRARAVQLARLRRAAAAHTPAHLLPAMENWETS